MQFDSDNLVVKLCSEGIQYEGLGDKEKAKSLYQLAWEKASTDFEKFTAAHYLARHQPDYQKELEWNQTALHHALAVNKDSMRPYLPSLYLNIAKSFEQMGDLHAAYQHCRKATDYSHFLSNDGYGKMINSGIKVAIERLKAKIGG